MLTEEGKNENFPCVTGVLLEQRGNRRTEHPRKQQNTKRLCQSWGHDNLYSNMNLASLKKREVRT